MRISDIKSLKVNNLKKLSDQELKKIVKDVAKVVNAKINKLYRAGAGITGAEKVAPDAYQYMMKSGGLISTYDDLALSKDLVPKSKNGLIREIQRAKHFLGMSTSNVKVARNLQKIRKVT